MNFMKYTIISLVVAVVVDLFLVTASANKVVGVSINLIKNETKSLTKYYVKDTMNAQYYENTYASTPLNSPCQGCKISAKPILRNGDYGDAVTVKMGEKARFKTDVTKTMGEYTLLVWRKDLTALNTDHTGIWTIN